MVVALTQIRLIKVLFKYQDDVVVFVQTFIYLATTRSASYEEVGMFFLVLQGQRAC